VYVPESGRREKATFPSGQVVERSCGGTDGTATAASAPAAEGDEAKERGTVAVDNIFWSATRLVASCEVILWKASLSKSSLEGARSSAVRVGVSVAVTAVGSRLLA